jgi:hypothetical protein
MVTGPGVPPVTVILQLVPESVQVAGDGSVTFPEVGGMMPPAAAWEKVIVSPEIVPEAPDTLAVHWDVAPAAKEAGLHETEVVVVVGAEDGEYMKVVVCVAVKPPPPHVALMTYCPAIQQGLPPHKMGPPATVRPLYAPVAGLTGSFWKSTVAFSGFKTVTMTAVLPLGTGDTVPLIMMCATPV